MKNYILIQLITISIGLNAQNNYYYGFDKKIALFQMSDTFVIRCLVSSNKINTTDYKVLDNFDENTFVASSLSKSTLVKDDRIVSVQLAYRLQDGISIYPTEEIIFRKRDGVDEKSIIEVLAMLHLNIKRKNENYSIAIVQKGQNVIDIANKLYESNLFLYAYPNFYAKADLFSTPNDPFFSKQFYLKNTGQVINDGHSGTAGIDINVSNAWDVTKGTSGITIAVIDEGVSSNHPDLPNSRQVRLNGSDFSTSTPGNDPSPSGTLNHGNACSGIIAASQDNNEGISGIAPLCKIMPVKMNFGVSTSSQFADAINFAVANGAKIISNSWGYSTSDPNFVPAIVTAINNAISNNCIVVFAAGNTANLSSNNTGFVSFPASCNVSGLMVAGACDRNGSQANYSPSSSIIDFVAPSHKAYPSQISGESFEVWSIDIPGSGGWNPCSANCNAPVTSGEELPSSGTNYLSYTGRMGGTSSACPEVAGVAALVLTINPCLSPLEVENIIKNSCKKLTGYTFTNGRCDEVGFGLIDATASVNVANNRFLQNQTENTMVIRANVGYISAGYNVTSSKSLGNYVIANNANVDIKSTRSITFMPGFKTINGAVMYAHIEQFNNDCINWPSSFKSENNTTFFETEIFQKNEKSIFSNDIRIFPNPFADKVNVSFILEDVSSDVRILITDVEGRSIYDKVDKGNKGDNNITIPFHGISGVFIVKVCIGSNCKIEKLLHYADY
jgi:subtilisin family serine protease